MNVVTLMGRLVADPEIRYTQNNVAVTRFRVAVDRATSKDSEKKTDFIDVQAWRQTAEFVCKYFRKGAMIAVQGEIRTDNYTDKDGNKRYSFEVLADRVHFTCEKAAAPQQEQAPAYQPTAPQPQQVPQQVPQQQTPGVFPSGYQYMTVGVDEDIPF